jgi:large subunit ribosomal protein L22
MGSRKQEAANRTKEERKGQYLAALRNNPTSPRKMRLVADMIRGMEVRKALDVLRYNPKEASRKMEKLLLSAISNWQAKNEGIRIEDNHLVVKQVFVDSARILKRLRPAPQGRGHRIKKRSNHVTILLDTLKQVEKTDA